MNIYYFIYLMPWKFVYDLRFHEVLQTTNHQTDNEMKWINKKNRGKTFFSSAVITAEARKDLILVPGSSSFRHVRISLPVRGFFELLQFFDLFNCFNFIFNNPCNYIFLTPSVHYRSIYLSQLTSIYISLNFSICISID